MPEPKALLRVRRIDTIGLVDKGDNPESDIVFWKREDEMPAITKMTKKAETFEQAGKQEEARRQVWDLTERMSRAISSAVFEAEDGQDPTAIINDSLDQFAAAVRAAAPNWLAGQPVQKHQESGTMPEKFDVSKLDEAARAEFKRLEDANGALATELKEMKDRTQPPAKDMLKGLSPEARAEVEAEMVKRDNEITKLRADHDAVVEKAERDGLAIRFAKGGDLENIGGDKRVDVLLAAKRALGELWPALETMLKAASEQIAKGGLFGEKGKGGDGEGATAWNKLEAAAKELVDKGEAKTLAQAIVAVGKRDPKLYREYKAEQKG